MSTIGVNANIYSASRHYLEVLNDFVIQANYLAAQSRPIDKTALNEFIQSMSSDKIQDPQLLIVYYLFEEYYQSKGKTLRPELMQLGDKLNRTPIDPSVLDDVKDLISVLSRQCSQSFSKIKGGR